MVRGWDVGYIYGIPWTQNSLHTEEFDMLEIITLPVLTDNYIYVVHDRDSKKTAVVDPALAEPVLALLNEKGWGLS